MSHFPAFLPFRVQKENHLQAGCRAVEESGLGQLEPIPRRVEPGRDAPAHGEHLKEQDMELWLHNWLCRLTDRLLGFCVYSISFWLGLSRRTRVIDHSPQTCFPAAGIFCPHFLGQMQVSITFLCSFAIPKCGGCSQLGKTFF